MHDDNEHVEHVLLLGSSFRRLLGFDLLPNVNAEVVGDREFAEALFETPAVVVSHGVEDDPVFNYGNRAALELFEMDWDGFTELPSRHSAEPLNREERARLLDAVTRDGYIDDYSGVRISSTGRRFLIPKAIVWNVIDDGGVYRGQAATFASWDFIE